jgi:nicotinate (nicotinamide) nucleotide adenylyltransferase
MKKVLIYPGAFNPPHYGHISTVELALKKQSFDEVWIIPSGKRDDKIISTSYEDRRNLGNIFVEFLKQKYGVPVKLVTDELDDLDGKFTHEILGKIKSQSEIDVTQLIGLDGMMNLYQKIMDSNAFETEKYIVVRRFGYEAPESFFHNRNILMIDELTQDISSTQIRNMVHCGDANYQKLVPEEIADYIKNHSLYLN